MVEVEAMAVEHDQEETGTVSDVPRLYVETGETLDVPQFFIESEGALDVPQFFIVLDAHDPHNK